jgi:serine protease Do
MAVGNPLGLTSTVTQGIVSSLGRGIGINADPKGYGIDNFIQTDAAINPGNSGGGLYNFKGQVVGINSAIATRNGQFQGYGFAIPINMARTVASDIIKYGKVNRGYIGVNIRSVDATEAEALGLGEPRGVRIDNVVKGGGGELAGLEKNDIILSIDGHEVNESNQLQGMIALRHAGDRVTLRIWRDGKELDKVVTLKARDDDKDVAAVGTTKEAEDKEEVTSKKETAKFEDLGLTVRNMTESEKSKFDTKGGVVITTVTNGSEASDRGLGAYALGSGSSFYMNGQRQQGTTGVITQVARKNIRNVDDFENAINDNRGKSIGITVKDSKGDSRFFALKVPKE